MDHVNLIIVLALIEYVFFILVVGATRGKYGIEAPATTGNPQWERYFRIQTNTTEQLILFFPALYAFAFYVSPAWAFRLGLVFLLGRALYFFGYRKDGKNRMPGAVMTSLTSYILLVGALFGLIRKLF